MKEVETQKTLHYCMIPFTQNSGKGKIIDTLTRGQRRQSHAKGQEETFKDEGIILYFGCGSGYTLHKITKSTQNCTPKMGIFCCM